MFAVAVRSPAFVALLTLALASTGVAQAGEGDPCQLHGKGAAVPGCVKVTHADTLKRDQTQIIQINCPATAPYY